jgi:formate dehydrogenase subunit delta
MQPHDMVRMTDQISAFFKSYSEKEAIEGIAEHINKFWPPTIRVEFFALIDAGGGGLNDIVIKAAGAVKRPKQVS